MCCGLGPNSGELGITVIEGLVPGLTIVQEVQPEGLVGSWQCVLMILEIAESESEFLFLTQSSDSDCRQ